VNGIAVANYASRTVSYREHLMWKAKQKYVPLETRVAALGIGPKKMGVNTTVKVEQGWESCKQAGPAGHFHPEFENRSDCDAERQRMCTGYGEPATAGFCEAVN
jgi:hypothetical protein